MSGFNVPVYLATGVPVPDTILMDEEDEPKKKRKKRKSKRR